MQIICPDEDNDSKHPCVKELRHAYRRDRINRRQSWRNANPLGRSCTSTQAFLIRCRAEPTPTQMPATEQPTDAAPTDVPSTEVPATATIAPEFEGTRGRILRYGGRVVAVAHPARYSNVYHQGIIHFCLQ